MTETQRQRIERHLATIAAWRASGLPLKTYVEQIGQDLTLWRARLTWESRWQQMLAGTYCKPRPKKAATFVKAIAPQPNTPIAPHPHSSAPHDSVCITINACGHSGLQANIQWPITQLGASSAWLREVLA